MSTSRQHGSTSRSLTLDARMGGPACVAGLQVFGLGAISRQYCELDSVRNARGSDLCCGATPHAPDTPTRGWRRRRARDHARVAAARDAPRGRSRRPECHLEPRQTRDPAAMPQAIDIATLRDTDQSLPKSDLGDRQSSIVASVNDDARNDTAILVPAPAPSDRTAEASTRQDTATSRTASFGSSGRLLLRRRVPGGRLPLSTTRTSSTGDRLPSVLLRH